MRFRLFPVRSDPAGATTEQSAYEALVKGCWDRLWRYAYRSTGNTDDAEDLIGETLLEGFRCFHQFRGETDFARWMMRVMTTTRIDMVRRAQRRRAESLETALGGETDDGFTRDIPDEEADPEAIVVGPMLSEAVQSALAALPEEFRAVVILADMEQMDYADVSRTLGIPIGTVRSRLHRSRQLLRKRLGALYGPRTTGSGTDVRP